MRSVGSARRSRPDSVGASGALLTATPRNGRFPVGALLSRFGYNQPSICGAHFLVNVCPYVQPCSTSCFRSAPAWHLLTRLNDGAGSRRCEPLPRRLLLIRPCKFSFVWANCCCLPPAWKEGKGNAVSSKRRMQTQSRSYLQQHGIKRTKQKISL